jgi:acetoin utilization deacetylase AcuC-like enzyme
LPTAYISHRDCLAHDSGPDHPETARRVSAIEDRLIETAVFDLVRHIDAPSVTKEQLLRVHSTRHLQTIQAVIPKQGYARLDPDTVISPETFAAARRVTQ